MYKIGVIGDRESVLGFSALGLSVFPAESTAQVEETVRRLAEEDYAVIYMTENAAENCFALIDSYKSRRTPAIILIPGKGGTLGIGMQNVKKSVEKAVGADILFKES